MAAVVSGFVQVNFSGVGHTSLIVIWSNLSLLKSLTKQSIESRMHHLTFSLSQGLVSISISLSLNSSFLKKKPCGRVASHDIVLHCHWPLLLTLTNSKKAKSMPKKLYWVIPLARAARLWQLDIVG